VLKNSAPWATLLEFLEARNAEARESAAASGDKLDGSTYIVIRKAGETGILYGSVSSRDVAELVGGEIKRNMVVLEQPIKSLGLHEVKVKLHPEVAVNVVVNVARSEDEAERQAKGEDVIATQIAANKADAEDAAAERAEIASQMFEGDAGEAFIAGDEAEDTSETIKPLPSGDGSKGEEE